MAGNYGLLGEHLSHSYSKQIHEALADYTYDLIELTKEGVKEFMTAKEFSAVNVTIPYKTEVIPYLDAIEKQAKKIGAVNTVVNKDGTLTGYNTDYYGFLYTLQKNNIKISGEKILVLGNGGAAKAVLAVLSDLAAKEIIIVKRSSGDGICSYEEAYALHSDATVLINTSPVGMHPKVDETPTTLTPFPNLTAVVDIIYNPEITKLLAEARSRGLIAVNGLEMLVAQAFYAVQYFLDTKLDEAKIEEVTQMIKETLY